MPIPAKEDKIVRISTRERVYNSLRQWIIDGTLQPDERLNDKEIAEHFSVSRTPVREALQMLAEQKFITVLPSSGTFVAPIDRKDMVEVYCLMGAFQALALEMGFERITDADIAQLRAYNAAFLQAAREDNVNETNRIHTQLHHAVAVLSGSSYLISFTDTLMMQAFRGETLFFKSYSRRTVSYSQHKAFIDALEKRDLPLAQKLIKENWDSAFWKETPPEKKRQAE